MSTVVSFLVLVFVLLAPFGLVAALARSAHGQGFPWFHRDQFRFAAPLAGPIFADDADLRRIDHDVDAIRTRFEHSPTWPDPGVRGERR
jgi:hypothetical protein